MSTFSKVTVIFLGGPEADMGISFNVSSHLFILNTRFITELIYLPWLANKLQILHPLPSARLKGM